MKKIRALEITLGGRGNALILTKDNFDYFFGDEVEVELFDMFDETSKYNIGDGFIIKLIEIDKDIIKDLEEFDGF